MIDTFSLLQKYTGISKYSQSEVITPQNIVSDMVDLLPQEIFNPNETFFDPAVKSGRFLIEIYNRLMASDLMKQAFLNEQDRSKHILESQLYGFATSQTAATVVRKALYNDPTIVGNIHFTSGKVTKESVQGAFNNMRFDVVIGNPPYNNGMDLDFVYLGYKLSNKYTVMITPAKWQTAADKRIASKMSYGQFRKEIVPHMSYVCFYPDSYDIFAISQADGIAYYMIDKQNVIDKCHVLNKCFIQKYMNSETYRDIKHGETLWNIGKEILDHLGNYQRFEFMTEPPRSSYKVNINKQMGLGGTGYRVQEMGEDGHWRIKQDIVGTGGPVFSQDGNLFVISKTSILRNEQSATSGTSLDVFWSDNIDECKSFYSYINSKFIRFLLLINNAGLSGIGNMNTWKLVPEPDLKEDGSYDWSHEYTDEYLYKKYNLPQKYRDVIESVIKERK